MFQINPSATIPIYRQIVEQVRRQVASGQLAVGTELPSVRSVAQQHAINPMTVSKAYSMLEAEGLLCRQRGMAMTVAAQPERQSHEQRLTLLRPHVQTLASITQQLQVKPDVALQLFKELLRNEAPGSANFAEIQTTPSPKKPGR